MSLLSETESDVGESVKMLDVGTDIRLFKDLSITFDYYNKLTTDLILEPRFLILVEQRKHILTQVR